MKDLVDAFALAYVEAALWSSNDESTPEGGEPMDKNYGWEDIDQDTLKEMVADCAKFKTENGADLALYDSKRWTPDELGGHDLWLSRAGHGCGYFDRDELPKEARDRLQDAARKLGEYYLYVGDDGKIYGNKSY